MADLAARAERAAGLRGHRRRHWAPRPGMRPPDSRLPARAARSSPYRSRRALPGRSTWPSVSAPAHQCSWPRTARRLDRHATYIVAAYVAAPPDDFNRRTELPAAADPKHPAV